MKNLGTNIRNIRISKGMSQVKLACRIGKANTFLNDIEHGRSTPSLKTLKVISEVLEVDIGTLFEEGRNDD